MRDMNDPTVNAHPSAPRWWQRPFVLSMLIALLMLLLALGWPLVRMWVAPAPAASASATQADLPWNVQPVGDGTRSQVFGLVLGQATLADVDRRWSQDLKVALIAAPGQPPALEAYVETFQAAFLTGKLVVAIAAEPAWLQGAWDRSQRGETDQGGEGIVHRRSLTSDDLNTARGLPVASLSFVPAASLDESVVRQRFGADAERHVDVRSGGVQLLYPRLGVAVALPPTQGDLARAKAIIQYVAPRDFEQRLAAPLRAAAAAAASAGA